MNTQEDDTLDVRGLNCPLPVLKARKKLKPMSAGQVLKVVATDPVSVIDIPHFCSEAGHVLVATDKEDDVHTFWIKRG